MPTTSERDQEIAAAVSRALAAALVPVLSRMDQRLRRVEGRVSAIVPRRHLKDTTKRRHREVVAWLGSRCPCCGERNVVTDDGALIAGAEFDHYFSRERRAFRDTWLICRPCHRDLTVNGREGHAAAFQAYQARAARFEASSQGELPLAY